MRVRDSFSIAVESLKRTRGRSSLTMIGIVIGIASVILVLSIGEAAQRFILAQVGEFGADLVFVENGKNPLEQEGFPVPFVKETLTPSDYRKLRSQSWVRHMTAVIMVDDQVVGGGTEYSAQVVGTTPEEPLLYSARVARGNYFTHDQLDSRARVIVLGANVARHLFGQEEAVGKLVRLGAVNFRVIGVMESAGSRYFMNVDDQVYMPFTAVMDLYNKQYFLFFVFKSDLAPFEAKRRTEALLREQHDILDPKDDDFHVNTQDDVIAQTQDIAVILQVLLVSIAAISLVVGGIGIMNIMYVSVTERIREIGLRKALGARREDILGQFLAEAVLLTTAGGVLGIVCGIGLTWVAIFVIGRYMDGWTFGVSTYGLAFGVAVSSLVGLAFGYAPARRAALLDPVEAMRKE
ncbi:FtsX-like permease family protein [Candidatus Uhrbacteria bacterium]|nr:MAG: FtsX-like permease family protein [Candidatus Uhrbacteria bacterium]